MNEHKPPWVAELLPELDSILISFLKGLSTSDWDKQTISPLWKVKDVVAHLLDGNIRRISMHRDGYFGPAPEITSYAGLVAYLNELNSVWVAAMQRTSPALLIDMLELTGPLYYRALKGIPPYEKATFSVAWAGEHESTHSFDVAREYTEKWHHQQQIREAFGNSELLTQKYYKPCLDTFVMALPVSFAKEDAAPGTCVKLVVEPVSSAYYIARQASGWKVFADYSGNVESIISISAETSWKLFTNAIKDREQARSLVSVQGDEKWKDLVVNAVAVMA